MGKLDFAEKFIWLKDHPISFADRPYLVEPYASKQNKLVIRASRQVEKSTFLVNIILYMVVRHPGIKILFVCPRKEQAEFFSKTRLIEAIEDSPLIRRHLVGNSKRKLPVMNLRFNNKSEVYLRPAFHTSDSARGISADVLLVDEFQDIAAGHLPVLLETMSHSRHRKLVLTGTPKTIDNHLENVFRQSTANEFKVPCVPCQIEVILDDKCLGPAGPICHQCLKPIDISQGRWVARNPTSTWGDGYWINHLMVPWVNYAELLEKNRTYNPALFKNECLGLPTTLGDHMVTRAELEACCTQTPLAQTIQDIQPALRDRLVAGIDWGGGAVSTTALVIGYMDGDYRFIVVRFERFAAREDPSHILQEVSQRCRQFGIRRIAVDGNGNGNVYNRMLFKQLAHGSQLFAIFYADNEQAPRQDGVLWRWSVGRSASIGTVFARVKQRTLFFPLLQDCGSFLDEIGCEIAEYDNSARSIRFTHPESQPDDTLHALNYAVLMSTLFHSRAADID